MDRITINGTHGGTVVDCLPILLRWQVKFNQSKFSLRITTGEQCVYHTEVEQSETYYRVRDIKLDKSRKYQVEVISYDGEGQQIEFISSFITSNFGEFDAKWITNGNPCIEDKEYYQDCRNTIVKRELNVSALTNEAYIHIVGLGYYNLYINGIKVSNYVLNNDWTNYSEIVYYDTFDIQNYLHEGSNKILIELANGWYNPAPVTLFGKYNLRKNLVTGEPKLLAEVVVRDNEAVTKLAVTDESWHVAEGPYLFNNMYLGETLDFRLFDYQQGKLTLHDTDWGNACVTEGPKGKLLSSYIEKITEGETVKPVSVTSIDETRHLIDFGVMISGFIDTTIAGTEGQEVEFVYSEEINTDQSLNTDSSLAGFVGKEVAEGVIVPGGEGCPERAEQRDKCICRDGDMEYRNQYTYHSFRYVEVKGLHLDQLLDIEAVYAHNKLAEVGSFKCSNDSLNRLYEAARNTKLNNIHSVIEDCARERFAYGGDMIALAPSQVMMFDTAKLYEKTIFDFIADRASNGGFPETAPFMGIQTKGTGDGAGPLGWQLAVPYLLNTHYQYYGDAELVLRVYPYLEEQFKHLQTLDFDQLDNYCLGDWGSKVADKENIKNGSPALKFTAACFYYYHLTLLVRFSEILEFKENCKKYQQLSAEVKQRLIDTFRNDDGSYADKSQTSYIFALYFDLERDPSFLISELERLIVASGYDLQLGIFGQGFFYSMVNQLGLNHLVYDCLQSSLGVKQMLSDGSGALKEFFGDNRNGSCNHAMFSSYAYWFYSGLGGISVSELACGADQIFIKPYFEPQVDQVETNFESVHGNIVSKWIRKGEFIDLMIKVPHGVKQSLVVLPIGFSDSVDKHLISHLDEKYVYIDISDSKILNLTLNAGLVCAKESC